LVSIRQEFCSGDTFEVALNHIRACGTPAEVRTAALHHKTVSHFVPDFYARKVIVWRWIVYPWAVIEDLSTFLEAMAPRPDTPEAFAARLAQDHRLEVPRPLLVDALVAASRHTWKGGP
jgi:hypoxanthine phosphoribosyltransferase